MPSPTGKPLNVSRAAAHVENGGSTRGAATTGSGGGATERSKGGAATSRAREELAQKRQDGLWRAEPGPPRRKGMRLGSSIADSIAEEGEEDRDGAGSVPPTVLAMGAVATATDSKSNGGCAAVASMSPSSTPADAAATAATVLDASSSSPAASTTAVAAARHAPAAATSNKPSTPPPADSNQGATSTKKRLANMLRRASSAEYSPREGRFERKESRPGIRRNSHEHGEASVAATSSGTIVDAAGSDGKRSASKEGASIALSEAERALQAAQEEADRLKKEAMRAVSAAAAVKASGQHKEADVVASKGMTKREKQRALAEADEAAARAATEAREAAEKAAAAAQEEADRLKFEMERLAAAEEAAAEAARATPQAAWDAMERILMACVSRAERREACMRAAPPETDAPWREKDEHSLGRARDALELAQAHLQETTQALRVSTTASADLLGAVASDIASYRERKERWNKEVDSLARKVEEACVEEAKCQASVEKLEQAKARAEAAIARDAAIASEAIAQALKQKVMEAIKAIEQMEGD